MHSRGMVFPINHPQSILLISQQDQPADFRRQKVQAFLQERVLASLAFGEKR
jgi:hypothetical protein